eukprot:818163-Prorocentrum_minimum.AAC.1
MHQMWQAQVARRREWRAARTAKVANNGAVAPPPLPPTLAQSASVKAALAEAKLRADEAVTWGRTLETVLRHLREQKK